MLKARQVSRPCSRQLSHWRSVVLQAPLGQLVDQAMLFGQRDEAGRGDGAELGIVPANQRLDAPQPAVGQGNLRLVDHAQPAVDQRPLEPVEQPEVRLGDHGTSDGLSSLRISSSSSSRAGFSSGPTICRPIAVAEPEGAFEHPAVEARNDQHRVLESLVGEEAQQLDPVHARAFQGRATTICGRLRMELVAELLVLLGDDRLKTAHVGGAWPRRRPERRLVVDQQQPRQRHFSPVSHALAPERGVSSTAFRARVKRAKPDFNLNYTYCPALTRISFALGEASACSDHSSGANRRSARWARMMSRSSRRPSR